MLKKISTLLLLTVALVSCSKDDDKSQESSRRKYVDRVITEQDGESEVVQVNYNNKMQITSYVTDRSTFSFQYENDRVVKVMEGPDSNPYNLYYSNGVLSGVDHYSTPYTVTYNNSSKTYSFDGIDFSFGLTGRDISFVDQMGDTRESFTYDTTKKGPLHNVEPENLYPVTLFSEFQYLYMSAFPIKTISLESEGVRTTYVAENVYDDEGYLIEATQSNAGNQLFKVTYEYITK